jgi:hypothetical protein
MTPIQTDPTIPRNQLEEVFAAGSDTFYVQFPGRTIRRLLLRLVL